MSSSSTRIALGATLAAAAATATVLVWRQRRSKRGSKPRSVNWHFTRNCNYNCQFCFHTAKDSYVMPVKDMDKAKYGLRLLKLHGMEKMNFSGGEPFLHKRQLGELVRFCKEDLQLDSVSIVSNGSLIDRQWMEKFGRHLDILAVSCDSFDGEVLKSFGRCTSSGKTDHIEKTKQVRDWCVEFKVVFKMNTVVNAKNAHEDMTEFVRLLRPKRWKVFQALLLTGENVGDNVTGRNASRLTISDKTFDAYIRRHQLDADVAKLLVPESNVQMRDSYLILDEHMRFLDCSAGGKEPGRSILEPGGVTAALEDAGHDEAMFYERGGEYEWRKDHLLDVEDLSGIAVSESPPLPKPAGFISSENGAPVLQRQRSGGA